MSVARGRWGALLAVVVGLEVAVAATGVLAKAALVGTDQPDNPYSTGQFLIGASAVAVGAFLAHRRPRHPMGWLLLLAGGATWLSFMAEPGIAWLMLNRPDQEVLGRVVLHLTVSGWLVGRYTFAALVPQAFPDGFGRSAPARILRGVTVVGIVVVAVAHSRLFTFEVFMGEPPVGTAVLAEAVLPWVQGLLLACAALAVGALVMRTVRADADQRRRTRWFVAATVVLLLPLLVQLFQSTVHDFELSADAWEIWTLIALPIVLAVGILRHGLFDIQVIVRRATVYGIVSALALAIYAACVWTASVLTDRTNLGPLLGAGIVVVTVSQIRDAVQRATARYLFGRRGDPYATIAALGDRLEAAPLTEQALQTVTDTIVDELRVPFAAIDLVLDDTQVRVAESGEPLHDVESYALAHQGIGLGRLTVGERSPGEHFGPDERRLLQQLARQAGVLAHNASLTEALRRSRAVLLNAREEERRRIRADLHDGLGPTLATVALGLGAASERIADEPELTSLLADLEGELQTAIADVRTLVYDLRPASLDDLGLVSALREHADALVRRTADSSRPLSVEVAAPDDLGTLPAAVEVAAYRVALEALTNVTRHARASECRIELDAARGLTLTVVDDGVGLPTSPDEGVGIRSMRDRGEELGGRFRLGADGHRGTRVWAWFPVAVAAG